MYWTPQTLVATTAFAAVAHSHTLFTTLHVNGVSQGAGTCVREPRDFQTATFPVEDVTSNNMICGFDGQNPVAFTCPVPAGAQLSLEFHASPSDASSPPSEPKDTISPSHKGPCTVYMKKVDNMLGTSNSSTLSSGWFKIYEDGYDSSDGKWCTERLNDNKGLLSVTVPSILPSGAYLVRPELLALHEMENQGGKPQFFIGCTQIYIESGGGASKLSLPSKYQATIPGYLKADDPSIRYNIYTTPLKPYPLPGPPVFAPTGATYDNTSGITLIAQDDPSKLPNVKFVPPTCIDKNANWCGVEIPPYTTEDGCWEASNNCYKQDSACSFASPPSGAANCTVWENMCHSIQAACERGDFVGPPSS